MIGILVFRSTAILKSQRRLGIFQLQQFMDLLYGGQTSRSKNISIVRDGEERKIIGTGAGFVKHKRRCERRSNPTLVQALTCLYNALG